MVAPSRGATAAARRPAQVFAALGDDTRLQLVDRLCRRGPSSIATLADGLPITRQAVTKHLRVIERAGLARSEVAGRERVWRIDPKPLQDARMQLDAIASGWEARLQRLKRFVEG